MAKKQKSKKKIETKTITKKDIDKLLEDNNIVVDEKKEVKSEEKKEKLKRTKRNAALYEKEVKEEQESNEEVEILDTKETLEIQEEILEDVEEEKELKEEIEELDAEVKEEKSKEVVEKEEALEEEVTEEINKEVKENQTGVVEEINEEATDFLEPEDKEEARSLLADDILEDEMDTSFLTKKSDKKHISTVTFKDNYNVLITVIFVLMVIFLGFLIFHYTTFNHHKVKVVTKIKEVEKVPDNYLFLGDSITDFYDLDKYYSDMPVVNSGKSGNSTTDILKDMKERVYQYNPSKVFLLIGTNDLHYGKSKDEVVKNIKEIISDIKKNRSKAEIYLESIYPVNHNIKRGSAGNRDNDDIKEINKQLQEYCKEDNIVFIDMYKLLKDDDDDNLKEEYTKDGLHLSDEGYEVVTKELKKYIK